jgi:hypothetical protein
MNMPGDATALREGSQQQQVAGAIMGLAARAMPNPPTKALFANAYIRPNPNDTTNSPPSSSSFLEISASQRPDHSKSLEITQN